MTALDELFLLRSFVRIAESGSISAAARTLKIPQPTLSRHLRTLEERAATALLRRDTHTMSLTEAGFRLLEDAKALLALADEAHQRLNHEQGELRGHLRLFSTIDLGQFPVTRIIAQFLAAHPGITVELSYSNRPIRMIEEGCDAGVVVGQFADESVVAQRAGEVVRFVCAAPALVKNFGKVKTLADLKTWPWLSLVGAQFGDANRVVLRSGKNQETTLDIKPIFTLEGATGLREATRSGAGVARIPEWLAREDLATGRLVRLLADWHVPALPVQVIYPSARALSARTREFVEFAVKQMAEQLRAA